MRPLIRLLAAALIALSAAPAWAAADLQINTPAISQLRDSMHNHFHQLRDFFVSGAVGLTADGLVAVRDASLIPLDQRQAVNALVAAENRDRRALYREIARENGHPEWEDDVRATFAQRWIDRARPGWWYQKPNGAWVQK